jgi:hypothetical protein
MCFVVRNEAIEIHEIFFIFFLVKRNGWHMGF